MTKLTKRQIYILNLIRQSGHISNREIKPKIAARFGEISRVTIVRDIEVLLQNNLIQKQGSGRSLVYVEKLINPLLKYYPVEDYFSQEQDERSDQVIHFNFAVLDWIDNVFSKDELYHLTKLNQVYQRKIKNMTKTAYQKELERWLIELSWKSSRIEGNTYTLIDTEILIKEKKEATGHTREEAIMILNHKNALEYIIANRIKFKKLKLNLIEHIHKLLTKELNVKSGLRQKLVRIVGTNYQPLSNMYQIKETLIRMIKKINRISDPFSQAFLSILFIAYTQPFEDGNKRTSRLIGNAMMLANDLCPMSLRTIDEVEYKKAMILFYEQNSARYFKELFIKQFEFAVNNYF